MQHIDFNRMEHAYKKQINDSIAALSFCFVANKLMVCYLQRVGKLFHILFTNTYFIFCLFECLPSILLVVRSNFFDFPIQNRSFK